MPIATLSWLAPFAALFAAGLLAGFAAGIFGIGGGFVVPLVMFRNAMKM